MLNKVITAKQQFAFHFRLSFVKPFSNHLVWRPGTFPRQLYQEAVVLTFGIIGLAFAALCVLGSLASSQREPSI